MRIAFVSTYPPSKGTLNEYGFYLLNHFRKKPEIEEIILITDKLSMSSPYKFEEAGASVKIYDCWRFNAWGNLWNILRVIKKTKPDIVLFNIQFLSFGDAKIPAALGLLTPLFARIFGIPSIVLLHNIMEEVDLQKAGFSKNLILITIFRSIGTCLTKIILGANLVAVTIAKYVIILEKKYKAKNVALVPHGSFEVPPTPIYILPKGPLKVMTFGKFGTYKKVEVLIEAVELVRTRTDLDIEIVIAGTDSPNKIGYLESIKKQYKIVKQLTFTGYVSEEDVPRIFTESAVTVFPYSSTTGSSGVLHQSGSYGVAAILPDIGDLAQLVREEGYTGEFFEPENVESLANAIQKVLQDENYRQKLGKANYFAAVTLPLSDIADWYLLHFKHIINRR